MNKLNTYLNKFYSLLESKSGHEIFFDTHLQGESSPPVITELGKDEDEKEESVECSIYKVLNWTDLFENLLKQKKVLKGESMLIVWGKAQKAFYIKDGKLIRDFVISTGKNGFSNKINNGETATGLMYVSKKVKAPKMYQVLVAKNPIPLILGPNQDSNRVDSGGKRHTAEVLTGLLELTGMEKCNENVKSRNIYFHGTNREKQLGTKASGGCVRVSNSDIIWLVDNIPVNTKVYIQPDNK